MGKDFYEKYKALPGVFEQRCPWLDLDSHSFAFEENDKLGSTEYTQAALLPAYLAMEKAAEEYGLIPVVTETKAETGMVPLGSSCRNHLRIRYN